MIDHMSVKVKDFDKAAAFYEAALAPLGYVKGIEYPGGLQLHVEGEPGDVWVMALKDDEAPLPTHIAFTAKDAKASRRFTRRRLRRVEPITAPPVRAITIPATMRRSCTISRATTSKPSSTTLPSRAGFRDRAKGRWANRSLGRSGANGRDGPPGGLYADRRAGCGAHRQAGAFRFGPIRSVVVAHARY